MVGDFNFTGMSWHGAGACEDTLCESMFRNLINEHQLQQLITKPTTGNAILDLVFVSNSIIIDEISCLPPISTLDHDSQLLRCQLPGLAFRRILRRVDNESLCLVISNNNWTQAFGQCRRSDDFATRFTNLLSQTIASFTKYVPSYRRQRLPRHMVHLLRANKKAWTRAKCTGNITLFKTASRVAHAALRQYRRNGEERLIYSNNRNLLFS